MVFVKYNYNKETPKPLLIIEAPIPSGDREVRPASQVEMPCWRGRLRLQWELRSGLADVLVWGIPKIGDPNTVP